MQTATQIAAMRAVISHFENVDPKIVDVDATGRVAIGGRPHKLSFEYIATKALIMSLLGDGDKNLFDAFAQGSNKRFAQFITSTDAGPLLFGLVGLTMEILGWE